MAQYNVTQSCGHTVHITLFGKGDARRRKMAAMEREICPACRKAEADAAAETAGLPLLTGSDKQIAWASDIRAQLIARADKFLAEIEQYAMDNQLDARQQQMLDAARENNQKFRAQTKAAWFIDHQHATGQQIANGTAFTY